MSPESNGPTPAAPRGSAIPRVIVATTALLTFISFWRAAAIVLNDLASSAYYAGGEAEGYIGKTAPWFIRSNTATASSSRPKRGDRKSVV